MTDLEFSYNTNTKTMVRLSGRPWAQPPALRNKHQLPHLPSPLAAYDFGSWFMCNNGVLISVKSNVLSQMRYWSGNLRVQMDVWQIPIWITCPYSQGEFYLMINTAHCLCTDDRVCSLKQQGKTAWSYSRLAKSTTHALASCVKCQSLLVI